MWRQRTRSDWAILIFILFLAASLRLTHLDLIEFKLDEATMAHNALLAVEQRTLPPLGQGSSQGPHHPPLMTYLLALPFTLSRDPRVAAGLIASLGVAAVGLTYWIGRNHFGRRTAFLAALLFAASPWAVVQSRKIWTQNVPALTVLFIAPLMALVATRRRWALTAALVAAAFLFGLHIGGIAFFFVVALTVVSFPRRVSLLPLLAGLVAVLLILSPYTLYEAHNGWPNLRAFTGMARLSWTTDLKALSMAALATGGYHLEDLAGERYAEFVSSIVDVRWLDRVEIGLLWIGLAWLVWRIGRGLLRGRKRLMGRNAAHVVLLFWFTIPLLLLLRHSVDMFPHTVQLLYPSQHLIVALLLTDVAALARLRWGQRAGHLAAVGGIVLVGILVAWQVYLQGSVLRFVDAHDTPGGYGAPLQDTLAAVRRAEALDDEVGGAEILPLLPGADVRFDGDASVFSVLLAPGTRLVDGRQALVFPAQPAIYLAVPGADPGIEMLEGLASELPPALPVRTGSKTAYRFFHRAAGEIAPAYRTEGAPIHWASGATLLGYDWSGDWGPGNTVRWQLYLRVEGEPPNVEIHWFNQLIDQDGNQWGQMDGPGLPTASWRYGDTILLWFDIAISPSAPPPPYFMRTGAYTYPDIANVQLLDPAGLPAGEFVILGPLGLAPQPTLTPSEAPPTPTRSPPAASLRQRDRFCVPAARPTVRPVPRSAAPRP